MTVACRHTPGPSLHLCQPNPTRPPDGSAKYGLQTRNLQERKSAIDCSVTAVRLNERNRLECGPQ